ncbi:MAG: hypothetical protein M4579_002282 [Chaenotheca gracillima]|nr:MAG: hypothetical protein M4579_002282 [Chaenotheca gracillima]
MPSNQVTVEKASSVQSNQNGDSTNSNQGPRPQKKESQRKQNERENQEFYGQSSNGAPQTPVDLAVFCDHLASFARFFKTYGGAMDDLTQKHAIDLKRENDIKMLEDAFQVLNVQRDDRIDQLEQENHQLKNAGAENERIREEIEQQQIEQEIRKREQDEALIERERVMEEGLKQKHEKKRSSLEKKLQALRAEKDEMKHENHQLQRDNKKLESELQKHKKDYERDLEMYRERTDRQEVKLQGVEFAVESKSTDFYREQFSNVCGDIESLARKYFGQSIEYALVPGSCKKVGEISTVLRMTPIPATNDSTFLQVMAVKNTISRLLVDSVWTPVSAEAFAAPLAASVETRQALAQLLQDLSDQLETRGDRSEIVWRSSSHWALEGLSKNKATTKKSELIADQLFELLSPLARRQDESSLRKDLRALIDNATTVWRIAEKDARRIQVTWPAAGESDQAGWIAEVDKELENCELPAQSHELLSRSQATSHCTFPRILSRPAPDDKNGVVKLHGGQMLWADSKAVVLGLVVYERAKDGWEDLKRRHDMEMGTVPRRMSESVSGPSAPFRTVDYR